MKRVLVKQMRNGVWMISSPTGYSFRTTEAAAKALARKAERRLACCGKFCGRDLLGRDGIQRVLCKQCRAAGCTH